MGSVLLKQHEDHGVKLHMNKKVVDIKGDGKIAHTVILDDGTEIKADLLLLGAGVFPSTKFLQNSEI